MESRKNEFSNFFIASKSLDFYNMSDNVDLNTQQSGNPLTQTKCRSCLLSLVPNTDISKQKYMEFLNIKWKIFQASKLCC